MRQSLFSGWAHTKGGHAAAAQPSAASNSRRPMVIVMHPSRARVRKFNDTTPRARCPNCVAPGAGGAARRAPASTDRRPGHAPGCFQELSALPPEGGSYFLRQLFANAAIAASRVGSTNGLNRASLSQVERQHSLAFVL